MIHENEGIVYTVPLSGQHLEHLLNSISTLYHNNDLGLSLMLEFWCPTSGNYHEGSNSKHFKYRIHSKSIPTSPVFIQQMRATKKSTVEGQWRVLLIAFNLDARFSVAWGKSWFLGVGGLYLTELQHKFTSNSQIHYPYQFNVSDIPFFIESNQNLCLVVKFSKYFNFQSSC